jgi:hypothetical protein
LPQLALAEFSQVQADVRIQLAAQAEPTRSKAESPLPRRWSVRKKMIRLGRKEPAPHHWRNSAATGKLAGDVFDRTENSGCDADIPARSGHFRCFLSTILGLRRPSTNFDIVRIPIPRTAKSRRDNPEEFWWKSVIVRCVMQQIEHLQESRFFYNALKSELKVRI